MSVVLTQPSRSLRSDRASAQSVPHRVCAFSMSGRSLRQARRWAPLFCAFRMCVVHRAGNRVVVKRPRIQGARELQHLDRLLTDLRRRNNGLLAGGLVGQAGLPGIEGALRIPCSGTAEMVDHRVLIADNRVLVTRPEFAVNRVPASRAGHHQIGLKENRLLCLDIRRRVAVPVGSRRSAERRGGKERRSQDNLSHRNSPKSTSATTAAYLAAHQFQEQQHTPWTNFKYKTFLF